MEMESEEPGDDRLEALFDDIKGTLNLPSINSDYRTLGLWPDYLKVAWGQLKPISGRDEYRIAGDSLRNTARALARQLPHRFILDAAELKTTGVDVAAVVKATARFEELLQGLIINVALLLRDWRDGADLACSPFPAAARLPGQVMNWREYQTLQRLVEVGEQFISYVDRGDGEPVLLHGIPTWGYMWHGLLQDLLVDHRVLIPDLLGFGFSDKADRFDRSIARQAEAVDAWMETIGVDRAAVIAHYIGGGVALRLATLFPRRVSRF